MDTAVGGDIRSEEMLLNMGPQHPSTHGVLRVVVRTDGEIVLDCEPHIGYLHRCFEKIAENETYLQVVPHTDRMDYLHAMGNNLGYALTVEKLMGLAIPERANYIRVIVTELNRIASHMIAIGTYGLDTGAITPFFFAWRDRERILKFLETICGQRLNYTYIRVGGVAYDLQDELVPEISKFLDEFERNLDEYDQLLSYNGIFIHRTANIGVLPVDVAVDYGVTGPSLRASGLKRDLRKDRPYCIYDRFQFDVPIGSGEKGVVGDCWDRYMVRVRECRECVRILRQAIKDLPSGEFHALGVKKAVRPPKGECYLAVENARGELGYWLVSDASDKPLRLKARAPSFSNISVLPEISRGCMVADLIVIIGSLDIVLGEIDR
jgi:NADH-quinone oxidoreductase subunit D